METALTLDPPLATETSCVVIDNATEAEGLRPAWEGLLERSAGQELTHTPDWLLTWWRVYGARDGRQLRLALFYDADRLIGLAPLLFRRHWHRPGIPFRRLEYLASGERHGHGICSNYLNVIAEAGTEEHVARRLAGALATGELGAWDEVVLPMMAGDGPMPGFLVAAFHEQGIPAETTVTDGAPYIPLPSTWDHYLKALPRKHRHNLVRSMRAFEAWSKGDARLERVMLPNELEKGKQILIELHHARWEKAGETGVFRAPDFLRFHDQIMPCLLEQSSLGLVWLSVR